MLTNFHLPQSSLLMLVCAFAGREFVLDAYRHAVAANYRFFSYGDCMLLLQPNRPKIVRQIAVHSIGIRQGEIPVDAPIWPPGIPAQKALRRVAVAGNHQACPPTTLSLAAGIGTFPVWATESDSKLAYTVKPKTKP